MAMHFFQSAPDPGVHTIQAVGNVASAGAVVLAWVGLATDIIPVFLATLVSLAALVFYCLQIYDSRQMRLWRYRRREHRIVSLKARVVGLEARQIFEDAIKTRLPSEVSKSTLEK